MKKVLLKARFLLATIFGGADKFLAKHIDAGIDYASQIRSFVESPVTKMVVALTPTKIDDIALGKATEVIDKVVADMALVKSCTQLPTPEERLACFVKALKDFSPHVREALYLKFASLFSKISSGVGAAQSAFDTAVQTKFLENKTAK